MVTVLLFGHPPVFISYVIKINLSEGKKEVTLSSFHLAHLMMIILLSQVNSITT